MSKPETLKDLLIVGTISKTNLRQMADAVLSAAIDAPIVEGYDVELPEFNDLDDRAQGYLIKVLLEAKVTNVLDSQPDDEAGEEHLDFEDLPRNGTD